MSTKIKEEKKLLAESYEVVLCTILSIVGGVIYHTPALIIVGGSTALFLIWECISSLLPRKKNALDDTFRLLNMKNRDDIMPHVLTKSKNAKGRTYCLKLPVGMKYGDFKSKSEDLETAFGCPVELAKGNTPDTVVLQLMEEVEAKRTLKFADLFKLCGLENKAGISPRLIGEGENKDGTWYAFNIPDGMKMDDFESKKKELENSLKKQICFVKGGREDQVVIQTVESTELSHELWLKSIFELCGIKNKIGEIPVKLEETKNNLGEQFKFSLPIGLKIEDIEGKKSEIQVALGGEIDVIEGETSNIAILQRLENALDVYKVQLTDDIFDLDKLGELEFPIGMMQTARGIEVASIDFDKCERHVLVNGGTGAGKSTVLRLIYAMAIMRGMPIHAIDSKGTEAGVFKHYENMILSIFTTDGVNHLNRLYEMMLMRFRVMYYHDAKDYRAYNKLGLENKIEPILLIFDEFAPYRKNKACKEVLGNLLSIARAAGIYVILSTQRIDSETMGDLKTNLGIRLSMRAETEADSGIAMGGGDKRAYKIKVPGRLYMKYDGKEDIPVQSFLLDENDCLTTLKKHKCLLRDSRCVETMFATEYDIDVMTGKPLRAGEGQSIDLQPYMLNQVNVKLDDLNNKLSQIHSAIESARQDGECDLMMDHVDKMEDSDKVI